MVLTMDSGVRRGSFQSTPPPEGEPGRELPFDTSTKEGRKVQRKEGRFKGRKEGSKEGRFASMACGEILRHRGPAPHVDPGQRGNSRICFERPHGGGSGPSRRTPQPEERQNQPTPRIASMTRERRVAKSEKSALRVSDSFDTQLWTLMKDPSPAGKQNQPTLPISTFQSQHSNLNIPISTFQSQHSNLNIPISTFQSQHSLLNDPQTICVLQPEVSPALREQL
jgi:hypothetical protein